MIDRDSKEMERVIEDCLARAGMDRKVYETDWLPDDRSIFWQGDDLDEFLRLASIADAKLLYLVKLWTATFRNIRPNIPVRCMRSISPSYQRPLPCI